LSKQTIVPKGLVNATHRTLRRSISGSLAAFPSWPARLLPAHPGPPTHAHQCGDHGRLAHHIRPPAISFSASLAGSTAGRADRSCAVVLCQRPDRSGNGWNVTIVSSPSSATTSNVATPYTSRPTGACSSTRTIARGHGLPARAALFGARPTRPTTPCLRRPRRLPLQIPGINAASNVIPAVVTTAGSDRLATSWSFDMCRTSANAYAVPTAALSPGPLPLAHRLVRESRRSFPAST